MLYNKKKREKKYDNGLYLLSRLYLEYVKPEQKTLLMAVFCMIIIAITTAASAWLLEPAINYIFVNHDIKMLYIVPIAVVINSIVKGIASFFEGSLMRRVGQKIVTDIQLKLYSHLIYADMKFLIEYPSGNLLSRFTNDINAMRRSVTDIFTNMAKEFVTIIGLLVVMFFNSPQLTLGSLIIFPIAFYPISILGRRMRKIAKSMQEQLGDFTVHLDETFKNIRIIKSYCREQYEILRASATIEKFLDVYRKAANIESASSPIMETIGGIAVAGIIVYGGIQVFANETTPGAFVSFIAAMLLMYRPLKAISQINVSLQEGLAASRRLFVMIDEAPEITDDKSVPYSHFDHCNIQFKNVYFSYRGENNILNGLNLRIPEGKTVALVGSSGSGKTTILNLIQRLYDADYGDILIDGKNIQDIRLKALRDSIALVSQDIALFDDTIKENIKYGKLEADDEMIVNAAMVAAAHEFICALPDGYETKIGQHGVKLSGGEKQRISIARAILKDAPILLLDEATSALDAISEKKVQLALEYLKRNRTTIVIAHRLSTIENADLICVISDGMVSEYGSHQELLQKGGEYSELYSKYKDQKVDS